MRKSRFTDGQIIGMIKEQEAGLPTAELCRKHGLMPLPGSGLPANRERGCDVLQNEGQVWRDGFVRCQAPEAA